jgi:hypothetical protein
MHQRDQKSETRPAAATAPGLRVMTPMESVADILAEVGQRGNLHGLGAWATKAELVLATGRSRDFFERADRAGRLPSRVEMVPGHRRLRTVYDVAMVRQLLEAGR